jgi:hypothetical protein
VFGIGWLIIAIARATFPIFLTCSKHKVILKVSAQYREALHIGKQPREGNRAGRLKIPVYFLGTFQYFSEFTLNICKTKIYLLGKAAKGGEQVP